MLLGTLGTSLGGNILAGQGAIATSQGWEINRASKRVVRAGYGDKKSNKMNF